MTCRKWICLVFAAILISGCDAFQNRDDAQKVADALFQELANGVSERYLDFYADEFYEATSIEEWRKLRENLGSVLGSYQSHELLNWKVMSNIGSESTTVLIYHVTYAEQEAQETLTFFRSETPRLVGHHINFDAAVLSQLAE